jgi:hypothetical protein
MLFHVFFARTLLSQKSLWAYFRTSALLGEVAHAYSISHSETEPGG